MTDPANRQPKEGTYTDGTHWCRRCPDEVCEAKYNLIASCEIRQYAASERARDALRSAIELAMGPDPHSGGAPHPDTIDAITDGVLARIAVNNARPVAYKNEPWREQTEYQHVMHARDHIKLAHRSITLDEPISWLSDLGQPEAAHAGLRIDFLLHVHRKQAGK